MRGSTASRKPIRSVMASRAFLFLRPASAPLPVCEDSGFPPLRHSGVIRTGVLFWNELKPHRHARSRLDLRCDRLPTGVEPADELDVGLIDRYGSKGRAAYFDELDGAVS